MTTDPVRTSSNSDVKFLLGEVLKNPKEDYFYNDGLDPSNIHGTIQADTGQTHFHLEHLKQLQFIVEILPNHLGQVPYCVTSTPFYDKILSYLSLFAGVHTLKSSQLTSLYITCLVCCHYRNPAIVKSIILNCAFLSVCAQSGRVFNVTVWHLLTLMR